MPRLSEAEKRKSHIRIVDAAAALFREQGIEQTSVAEVMQAAGMTHGGFYRHFEDKKALVAAAFEGAVDSVVSDMEASETEQARAVARANYIDTYLSMEHVRNRRQGCPMASLGSELGRSDGAVHAKTAQAVDRVTGLLRTEDSDDMTEARLALLVGAVTVARLTQDDAHAERILSAARAAVQRI